MFEHYIKLYFNGREKRNFPTVEMTLDEISTLLFCTNRNSKLVIDRLIKGQWIEWAPGRGRGNKSRMTFLENPEALLSAMCKEMVQNGDLQNASKYMEEYQTFFPKLMDQFKEWMESLFGFHQEETIEGKKDILRLKVNITSFFPSLDPKWAQLRSQSHVVKQLFDTLVVFDPRTKTIKPHLAFHWEYDEQRFKWTFYIRKGVFFHDGTPLRAEHAAKSLLELKFDRSHPFQWMLSQVESIEATEEYIVELVLKETHAFFLSILADERCSIVRYNQNAEGHEPLIGTGPFSLEKLNDDRLIIKANDHYFNGRPFLDFVELWNEESIPGLKEAGSSAFEFMSYVHPSDPESSGNRTKSIEWNTQFVSINTRKQGVCQNNNFRKLLHSILDPALMKKELGGPRGDIANGILPGAAEIKRDSVSEADLLRTSGYKGETLKLYTFTDQDHVEETAWIIERCADYGIKIEASFFPGIELLQNHRLEEADLVHDSANMTEQMEMCFLHHFLSSNSVLKIHLSEAAMIEVEAILLRMVKMSEREERLQCLREIENIMVSKTHILPLYRNQSVIEYNQDVQNIQLTSDGWVEFDRVWFKK
ncbi:ABC transporter substrate-binding protein [Falsibacillus pallidus]|uniref:MarR-like DNA-binding transcriptional regulator SgrR of sgrS sRNA n=1 Tax=Falsibacillus pallidus TaxID=493781 RepID=A0A370GQL7_9BACI|nr:ABC transporter substrate-binding protein [Falsibacillus pallidus]RDI45791.1 MarR-like DNA-binding transcriptional regulator SgrR of sgrS sRNA [Falsibacillus pallidus]